MAKSTVKHKPIELTPEIVITRTLSYSAAQARAIVAQLGDKAAALVDHYNAKELDAIRALVVTATITPEPEPKPPRQ